MLTITVQYQLFYSWPPSGGRRKDPPQPLDTEVIGDGRMGERGGPLVAPLSGEVMGQHEQTHAPHVFWSLDPPSGSPFSFVLLFIFLLAASRPFFQYPICSIRADQWELSDF
jgi:hypothetical protein